METRKLRNIGPELAATSFEAVVIKEEPKDDSFVNENPATDAKARSGNVKKRNFRIKKPPKQCPPNRRSRATQVCSEEIDYSIKGESKTSDGAGENEPIVDFRYELCPNLCRFCLRQASRENLKLIDATYRAKALACFRMRILYRESFKMACSNCLNLLDMLVDFKDAVTKAKKLLAIQKGHMESEEWDTAENVDAFNKCKTVVEGHCQQIDSLYNKYVKIPEEQLNAEQRRKCAEKSEEEQSQSVVQFSELTEDIPKIESILDLPMNVPPQVESSSCMMQESGDLTVETRVETSVASDGNDSSDVCEESDNDYEPDAVDEEDEVYISKKKTKKKSVSRAKDEKTASEEKSTNKKLCDFCGESLFPSSVESHRNQHLGIKPYACPEEGCELTFYGRYHLKTHIMRAHGSKKGESHVCNICGRVIRGGLPVLKYHQRIHNTAEKNYVCQVCGKAFTMKGYLRQHSVIHSGEMPHKCKYCGKRFNNKWSMKTHEKNIHEKNNHMPAGN